MSKIKVFIVHSLHDGTRKSFGKSLEKLCKENSIECYYPFFPKGENANYDSWKQIMDEYYKKELINEDTIIIGHSLGADFIPVYLVDRQVKIKCFISVAGFLKYDGENIDIANAKEKFRLSSDILNNSKELIQNRYSIYSDNDLVSSINLLEEYANLLCSNKIIIAGGGHFGSKSNIERIIDIEKIILDLKIENARKFCMEVRELAKKYDLPFFVVTDGASATLNNDCEAVKNARDNHKKWEENNNFDPYEDWIKDNNI